jgi:membrane protein implicated in regulation of membrane protease activity
MSGPDHHANPDTRRPPTHPAGSPSNPVGPHGYRHFVTSKEADWCRAWPRGCTMPAVTVTLRSGTKQRQRNLAPDSPKEEYAIVSDVSVIGCVGPLIVATRGDRGAGEVLLTVRGSREAFLAWSDEPLPKGTKVLVVEVRGARTVVVEPWTVD